MNSLFLLLYAYAHALSALYDLVSSILYFNISIKTTVHANASILKCITVFMHFPTSFTFKIHKYFLQDNSLITNKQNSRETK